MPVQVDLDERRRIIADAVWQIALRSGLPAASVRGIADETGLSTGSVRHFFPTQAALHAFAMEMVDRRVRARVASLELPEDALAAAEEALTQLLPLDAERRTENQVWLAFSVAAQTDPALAAIRDRAYRALRSASSHWVDRLAPGLSPVEREIETERLFALIDGLAVHVAFSATPFDPEVLVGALSAHLRGLAR